MNARNPRTKFSHMVFSILLVLLFLASASSFAQTASASTKITLVQIIDTGKWSPPAPDPAGIIYWQSTGHLLMSDSEVDEMPNLFTGKNLYELALDGKLMRTFSTTSFTKEPTGVAINPANGHFYVSQDGGNRIFEIAPGNDGQFWTSDDRATEFSVSGFGVEDSEDMAFGQNKMFISDGKNTEVWVIDPGPNGKFDGPPPSGDDTATHFDTARLGLRDVEGIAYDDSTGHLFLCSKKSPIVEVSLTGSLIHSFDISFVNPVEPDGITIAPGSNNSSELHIWVADRMVDNNIDPQENDGRIYEFAVDNVFPTQTPTSTPPGTSTPTATPKTACSSNNSLANSGFELDGDNNGKPDSWTSTADFTRSNAVVHNGNFAGKHFSTTNDSYTVNQSINATPGETVGFSGWVDIPATTDVFTFTLDVRWRDSAGNNLKTDTIETYNAATEGWNKATANLVAPAKSACATLRMGVTSLNAAIYVDDFDLKP